MAWVILAVFLICAGLMFTKRLPAMLALPLMALIIALLPAYKTPLAALALVFGTGPTRLAGAMSNAIFGAILAYVVAQCGIAQSLVKQASELAGDRPVIVAFLMMAATAFAFLAIGGLGSVIMVGTLVLPVMLGSGIRPLHAASIFLFGISIGGIWNVAGWGFYQDVLKVPVATIASFSTLCGTTLSLAAIAYILTFARARRTTWAASGPASAPQRATPSIALLTPLLPVLIILAFKNAGWLTLHHVHSQTFEINAALAIGALFGILTTRPREIVQLLSGAITEGIQSVAPVLGLMIGIGMVVTALMSEPVAAVMKPALQAIVPHSKWGYVLFFGLLSPLALYRGPLNVYGLGAGIGAILTTIFAPNLVAGALISTGMVQGVCDPTNTMNVWTAGFLKVDTTDILKYTLPFVAIATFIALILIALTG